MSTTEEKSGKYQHFENFTEVGPPPEQNPGSAHGYRQRLGLNMASTQEVTVLPALFVPTRSRGTPIPRRYEDTQPVVVQSYTHRRILDFGHDFHTRLLQDAERQTEKAVEAAEASVWQQAETIKQEAVDATVKRCTAEHERAVRKINKAHDKKLKEELACLRQTLEQAKVEAVAQSQQQCDARQREAVRNTEQLWQQRLLKAVEAARIEERQAAAEEAARVAVSHSRAMDSLRKDLTQEKALALTELSARKDAEQDQAVSEAREEERKTAEHKLAHLHGLFTQQINVLHTTLKEEKSLTSDLRTQLAKVTEDRTQTEAELRQTREEFGAFIRVVRPFNDSESEFIFPPSQMLAESSHQEQSNGQEGGAE